MKSLNLTFSRSYGAPCFAVLAFLLSAAALPLTAASDVSVRAGIQPAQIQMGQAAQLTVEISGAGSAKVLLPTVQNLDFVYLGQQSSWQMVNGLTSQKVFYIFQVVPSAEGQYTIPSFVVEAGDQKPTTSALTLKVGQGQAASNAATSSSAPAVASTSTMATATAANPAAPATASPRVTTTTLNGSKPTLPPGESAILQLIAGKTEVYVGQLIPVTVKLYVRADRQAELGHTPMKLLNDAFTFAAPTKLEQTREVLDGVPCNVATWNATMTPVKTGEYQISVEQPLRVVERVKSRRPAGFEDSFFDSVFTQYHAVDKDLQSPAQTWKVLPLPGEGKPDNFTGAIGEFTLTVKAQPDKVKVGEPINVEMIVDGKGNFDRVNAPAMTSTDGLKTYTPTSKIELRDEFGIEGRKVFTEAVIPNRAVNLPPVVFSFFNPELKQYVTRTVELPRIAITDAPAAAVAAATPASAPASGQTAASVRTPKPEDDHSSESVLVPIKVELTPFVANFDPVFYNPVFVAAQGIPLLALVAGFMISARRRRLESDPDYARAHETNLAVRAELEKMNLAVTRNDAAAFFTAARRAVQHRLAERWRMKVDDITFDAVSGHSAELAESLRNLFLVADQIAYSGEAHTEVALVDWQKAIVALLSRLEKKA
jgi:hypothetical protein